ncbi:uncharacterized protein LOC102232769 isoform X2 [Xiphophorus maculatus]|nr:uncharacterized protein LOC102232769 isoform X2 [Xiphophorus maculatus]
MALLKALRFGVLMLVICFTLDQPGFRQSVSVFFQDLRDATSSILHAREKRASSALSNFTEHDLQFVITFSDLESLQRILGNISFPIAINNTVEINSIETTTVCSPNITGYQCVCEENFAWSYNNCITYGVCDAIIGDTCGCINDLPAGDQFCQSNSSQTVTTTATPSSTQAIDLVDIDVDIVVFIPTSRVSSSIISYIRSYLHSITFPIPISQSLGVKELHFTTACDPNSANGLQCQCESGFAWPCDTCNSSNSCNDPSNPFCTCLNGLPSNNDYCQLITNSSVCPTPSPTPVTTVSTTPPPIYEIDLVLEVHIPFSSYQSDTLNGFRESLNNKTFLTPFSKSLNITELFLTTVCDPNSTYGYQCVCESGFAWPCDMCSSSISCSSQICTCIYGLPSSNEFCEPITGNATCPTPPPVTAPPPLPTYEIDLVLDVHIPVNSLQENTLDTFRRNLLNKTIPDVQQAFTVLEITLTTVCDPNSTYGYQCVCESGFAWPCDMCSSNSSCSSQICTCIYGLPSSNEFCEPITGNATCPTPPPVTAPPPLPTYEIDLVLDVHIPVNSLQENTLDTFRRNLLNKTIPDVQQAFTVLEITLTTVCDPNSTYGYQCVCESGFAWPCDMCSSSISCSSQICTCIYGLPSSNEFCEPITGNATCPTPPPVTAPPPLPTYEIDLVLDVHIPVNSLQENTLDTFRRNLLNKTIPDVQQAFTVLEITLTTVCDPNSTYGYQCVCESGFAWPCDMCSSNSSCSSQICTCIYGLPSSNEFCEPITDNSICLTPVDIDVDIVVFIPTSIVSSNIISYFRSYLHSITFPIPISQSLGVKELHFTTACDPNSANGLQCQCESGFAWPCDTCNSSNSCNDQTCTCLYGLPPNNEFCQPVSYATTCKPTPAPPTVDIDVDIVVFIPTSHVSSNIISYFRSYLHSITFPIPISQSLGVKELHFTTACDPNSANGLQCQCESGFAWPCDTCNSSNSCNDQTCTCLYGLPPNNEFCQPVSYATTCKPTPAPPTVDIDVDIVVFIPTSHVSSNIISYFRSYLHSITFPIPISQSLGVKELHFTTACDPNSANGLQCQCESGFAWPCDTCNSSNSCNDQTCTCLYGLPPNNEFCQPVSYATTCKPTPAPPTVDIDVDIVVFIPTSHVSSNIISYFRSYLHSITFPIPISQSLGVKELHFTTACDPNSANGLQCQCESGFAWPCDTCNSSNSCNDQTCTCLYGLPPNNEFCQPVSYATTCKPTPAPPTVDIDVDIVVFIPTSHVSSNIISYFRSYLHSITFPIPISQSLGVKELHFTTACDPNSANGLQCQCESGFAWPCDTCNSSNSCNNQTCTCLYGLPPNNEFCQPVSYATTCKPTPAPPTVDIDVDIVVFIPTSHVSSNIISYFRSYLHSITFPIPISQSLGVKELHFTTACDPNSANGLQCQCESGFAWPCDTCNSSNSCNNQTCTCLYGLPPNNEFCQPVSYATTCKPTPAPPTATTSLPFITSTPVATPLPTMTTPVATLSPTMTTPVATLSPTMTTPVATPSPITATPVATPSPITATPVATPSPKNVLGTFTMDMPFSESFNEKNNVVYQTVYNATLNKCTIVLAKCAVKNLNFKAGSTIANYELNVFSSETPTEIKVQITKNEILSEVASKYPVSIVSSSPLSVDKDPLYAGDTINVTCDTSGLTIGNYEILWTREGGELPKQSTFDKYSILIPGFSKYDDGMYGCKITFGAGSTFIQTRQLTSRALPLITVSPIKDRVKCSGTRVLTCQVDELKVTLFDPNGIDLGVTSYTFTPPTPCADGDVRTYKCRLTGRDSAKEITLVLTTSLNFDCTSDIYGNAMIGDTGIGKCDTNYVGEKTAVCMAGGNYGDEQNNCVLQVIVDLLDRSKNLNTLTIPVFLEDLKNATVRNNDQIIKSPATVIAMIKIFENVANTTSSLNIILERNSTRNFLESAGLLTIDNARGSWTFLNYNDTKNTTEDKLSRSSSSSAFLNVFENLPSFIGNDSLDINTDFILLNKTRLTDPFNSVYNSSVDIEIPQAGGEEKFITIIIFASMYNVLPGRDQLNTSTNRVHGRVALVRPEVEISNISLTFDVIHYTNDTIGNPKCVFWDFSLYDGLGGWSDNGCSLVSFANDTVRCNCNHTTSFSILMSPDSPKSLILDYITYIGVGISMACLVICLIIEAIIWRKINKNATSYLRHVSIVNIALSLLIANIWFIIGAAISDADQKNPPACTAATFFIHFFYLALFFWMLASALLLLYRTLSVFDGGLSKLTMLIIGFSLGYGAPLIIATITIAATAPSNQYIRENVICWLNWYESKALLAFVIPALLIVVINFVILIVVLYKILRRRVGGNAAQTGEKHVLYVIARSLAVLTPFFGLTWGLGVGVMVSPQNFGINVAFAFFNSLQGFFILVFGTLLDKKVWSAMNIPSLTSQGRTQSTSAGTSSSGLSNLFQKIRRNRGSRSGYHMSSTGQSASNDSFNT